MTDLSLLSAVKAAALIRSKKLSPVEYIDTFLKTHDRAQPKLNCFSEVMVQEARRDAKVAEKGCDRRLAARSLYGVPVSIKDLVDVKGVPTLRGSAIFDDSQAAEVDDVLRQRTQARGNRCRTKPGPRLVSVIGRPVAGDPGFDYSPQLRTAREKGDTGDVSRYLDGQPAEHRYRRLAHASSPPKGVYMIQYISRSGH